MPDTFWELTPAEFNDLRAAYYRRRRRDLEREAMWITVLVNHYPMRGKGTKTLRVEQLIGHPPEEIARLMRERKRKEMAKQAEADEGS